MCQSWLRTQRVIQLSIQYTCGQCAQAWRHTDLCGGWKKLLSHITTSKHWHTSTSHCLMSIKSCNKPTVIMKLVHGLMVLNALQQALLTQTTAPSDALTPDWSNGATAAANWCAFRGEWLQRWASVTRKKKIHTQGLSWRVKHECAFGSVTVFLLFRIKARLLCSNRRLRAACHAAPPLLLFCPTPSGYF